MLAQIVDSLKHCNIEVYRIHQKKTWTSERYYIKHQEDIRRQQILEEYAVTVFHDFMKNNVWMRGSSVIRLYPGMDKKEIERDLKEAWATAAMVNHPYYELPQPLKREISKESPKELDMADEDAELMTSALFTADGKKNAKMSYLEIFARRHYNRILDSNGLDVEWRHNNIYGEYAVRCTSPKDVECYREFRYNEPDTKEVSSLLKTTILQAEDRAKECSKPVSGEYDVIFLGQDVYKLLKMYLLKSRADQVYAGYSDYKVGKTIQKDCAGELLEVWMEPTEDFSEEGVRMKEKPLLEKGVLQNLHGDAYFCQNMGIEPTGMYEKIRCMNGTQSLEEMQQTPCMVVSSFSDFLVDGSSGDFAGEIRLAYLLEKNKRKIIQGGSVSGNLEELHHYLIFSKERYQDDVYDGPMAVRLSGVRVSGG